MGYLPIILGYLKINIDKDITINGMQPLAIKGLI
tara:strand:+ start:471 stop:572 length:102 start_codon:yes stop_codon:yes gene_type:complete